jgi:hypothetical protein
MRVSVLWGIRDFAQAIVELPGTGTLPTRTVLVPNAHVAHALRRELLRLGHAETLAGTRFVSVVAAAEEVLQAAGVVFTSGERELRVVRIGMVLAQRPRLKALELDLLLSQPGWPEAIAHAIDVLEEAGLQPRALPSKDVLGDVRVIWEKIEAAAGTSWTGARILREAAAVLKSKPTCSPFEGALLATASGHESVVQAAFVTALPELQLGLVAARPLRPAHLERVAALFGNDARTTLEGEAAPAPGAKPTERDLLASFFFEEPARLADARRPRSAGRDGSVDLEEHSCVEDEVEAAVDWVGREVLAGTPLEEIAVLMPSLHPLAGLVADRIRRLTDAIGQPLPVFVAGGLPLEGTAAGARALAVVRALRAHLPADLVAGLLPFVRKADEDVRVSASAAIGLAYSLGTLGGNPAAPAGALTWSGRVAARIAHDEAVVARTKASAGADSEFSHEVEDATRSLTQLRALQPAIDALGGVAVAAQADKPLPAIWAALHGFLADFVPSPGKGTPVHNLLDTAMRPLCSDTASAGLSGHAALAAIEEVITSRRVPAGRFGEPAVYVGTVAGAAGLPFAAVRVLGLAEGQLPSSPREDPVLPEAAVLEKLLPENLVPGPGDRVLRQLHALDRVVRGATSRVVLSAPRRGPEGSDREPSSIFIEAAAAIARPSASGEQAKTVPGTEELRRDYFGPARREARATRSAKPLTEAAWQARAAALAAQGEALPGRWKDSAEVDLKRVRSLREAPSDGAHGILGDGDVPPLPGLTPEKPISPSKLRDLLGCPHAFLLKHVLKWDAPAAAPSATQIETLEYGSLFHRIAERFSDKHGADFNARKRTLSAWQKAACDIANEELDGFLERYPLAGPAVVDQVRETLLRQVKQFIAYDYPKKPRTYVGAEVPFGYDPPLALKVGNSKLWVRGSIDRLDTEDGRALVRDLKTGKAHPRRGAEEELTPYLDLQIGVYGLVVKELAKQLGVPTTVAAAYAYVDPNEPDERSHRDTFDELATQVREWLAVAHALLKERSFPRSPLPDACTFCAFGLLCPADAAKRFAAIEGRAGATGQYRELLMPPADEEEVDA